MIVAVVHCALSFAYSSITLSALKLFLSCSITLLYPRLCRLDLYEYVISGCVPSPTMGVYLVDLGYINDYEESYF